MERFSNFENAFKLSPNTNSDRPWLIGVLVATVILVMAFNHLAPRMRDSTLVRHIPERVYETLQHPLSVLRPARALLEFAKISDREGPCGLLNSSGTFCYMNSTIQALASLDVPQALENLHGQPLLDTLITARDRINNITGSGRAFRLPPRLTNVKGLNCYIQNDAQEYATKIIDMLDGELLSARTERQSVSAFDEQSRLCARTPKLSAIPTLQNPFMGALAVRLVCTRCRFSEGLSIEPFTTMSLSAGHRSSCTVEDLLDDFTKLEYVDGVSCNRCSVFHAYTSARANMRHAALEQADDVPRWERYSEQLKTALKTRNLDDEHLAALSIRDADKMRVTKTKQTVVARSPESLVLHANLSDYDMYGNTYKKHMRVDFGNELDLGAWSLSPLADLSNTNNKVATDGTATPDYSMLQASTTNQGQQSCCYVLRAVVRHHGYSSSSGHYTCQRRFTPSAPLEEHQDAAGEPYGDTKDQWWQIDDSLAYRISESEVLNGHGVFMLYYDRVDKPTVLAKQIDAPQLPTPPATPKVSALPDSGDINEMADQDALKISHALTMDENGRPGLISDGAASNASKLLLLPAKSGK